MANDLIKSKKLLSYTPGTSGTPGSPSVPAQPAWTEVRTGPKTFRVSASSMYRVSFNNWSTPLQQLNAMTKRQWSAAQAHYSESWQTVVVDGVNERVPLSWTDAWVEMEVTETIYHPAKEAVAAVPPTAATPPRYVYDMQLGWNAGAYSAKVMQKTWVGNATFEVPDSNVGLVIGFSKVSRVPHTVRNGYEDIEYGLMLGDGRIRVRHAGIQQDIGALSRRNVIRVEVSRRHLRWFKDDVLLYTGLYAPTEAYVLAAAAYSGGDAVLSPAINDELTAEVGAISVYLEPLGVKAQGTRPWGLQFVVQPLGIFAGDHVSAQAHLRLKPLRSSTAPLVRGAMRINPLRARSSDKSSDATGATFLKALSAQTDLADLGWTPSYSVGNLVLPPPAVYCNSVEGQSHSYALCFSGISLLASENAYSTALIALAGLQASAVAEALTHLVQVSNILSSQTHTQESGFIALVLAERINALGNSSIEAAAVVVHATEELSAADMVQLGGKVFVAALEQIGQTLAHKSFLFKIKDGGAVLFDEGSTWAVNADRNASTRYENYSFNSFMAVGSKHFGVRFDGVYELGGDSDAGQPIEWMADLGAQDFGTQALKGLNAIYAGVSAQGTLFLRVDDGKGKYTYFARRVDAQQQVQRFDPGRGLRANYFRFELVGEGSAELDGIEFGVVATSRRI